MKADKKHLIWGSFCLFLLTMALSVILLPPAVSAAKSKVIAEGDCGKKNKETGEKSKDVKWELRKNGTMVISGKGSMQDYDPPAVRPAWWKLRKKIRRIEFQKGVDYVGDYSFYECENVEHIKWTKSINEVGQSAFRGCLGLQHLELPKRVKRWGTNVFAETGVTKLTIPDSDTYWEYGAFYNCVNLTRVDFENNAKFKRIQGESAVSVCSGTEMFGKCINLKEIVWDIDNMEVIPDGIFYGCTSLKISAYNWPNPKDSEQPIKYLGWYPDEKLKKVTQIPEGVEEIGDSCFAGSRKVKEFILPSTLKTLGIDCFYGSGAEKITMPEGVTYIGCGCFSGSQIKKIVIPESVETLGEDAFSECVKLKEIFLPGQLKKITLSSFSGCKNLEKIYISSKNIQKIKTTAVVIKSDNLTIYVPKGKKEAYRNMMMEGYEEYHSDLTQEELEYIEKITWQEVEDDEWDNKIMIQEERKQ